MEIGKGTKSSSSLGGDHRFISLYGTGPENIGAVSIRSTGVIAISPSGKFLKPLALGYDQVVADLLWMKTISYFGGHFMSDKQYPWLAHMLNLIIDLDPRFDFPYYFGGLFCRWKPPKLKRRTKF